MLFSAGDVSHQPFSRVQLTRVAVQSVGRPDDGYVAYWSEHHVSEDFDMAMRLQTTGHIVRLASYHDEEFKEGVSLTIYDELTRWEKCVHQRKIDRTQLTFPDTPTAVTNWSSTLSTPGYGKARLPGDSQASCGPTFNSHPKSRSWDTSLLVSSDNDKTTRQLTAQTTPSPPASL